MKRTALIVCAALWSGPGLLADFSYDQTSKVTGGVMAGMMKFAGAFSKQAREPMKTSILVKGDRMVNLSANSAQIIDLGKETVTHVDFQKKTYSVLTFAEYSKALEQLNAKMAGQKGDKDQPQMTATASVKDTGEKRNVAGFDARQFLLNVDMQGTDKDGKTATIMTMTDEMWVASSVAGYNEVRDFYRKMSQKLNWAPSLGMMAPQGSSKGMAELMKEMSKIDGVPIYQVVKMGGMGPQGAQGGSGEAGAQPPPRSEQNAEAQKPSAGGALGRLAGGRFGGLGGFGRKKKQEDQPAPAEQPAAQSGGEGGQQPAAQGGAGSLMEMTIESSNFSTGSVDPAKFEVPAGFKQVESEMLKAGRR